MAKPSHDFDGMYLENTAALSISDVKFHRKIDGVYTHEVSQIAPKKLPSQKERIVFQPSSFC